ncbi:hypothetical protein [Streptomyces sp. NPDC059215]|uniref:hypothetical protein n=1 Tax=Streptomyces sp. NPDC059215 TaxID=3346772 RepID=UPI00367AB224
MPHEEGFKVFSGMVLERLAKAALMRRHPVLIVELGSKGGAWETLLHLVGISPHDTLRTVSLKVALDRLRMPPLSVSLGVIPRDLDDLVNLRNASAHGIGHVEDPALVGKYVLVVDSLLADLGVDRTSFWMECLQAADYAKGGAEAKERDRVWNMIAKARDDYLEEHPDDSEDAKEYAYEWSKVAARSFPRWRLRDCPACENVGVMEGRFFRNSTDIPGTDERLVEIFFDPTSFRCTTCSLQLCNQVEVEYGVGNIPNVTDVSEEEFERLNSGADSPNVLGDV